MDRLPVHATRCTLLSGADKGLTGSEGHEEGGEGDGVQGGGGAARGTAGGQGALAGGCAMPGGRHGFHVMAAPSSRWVETLTGVGATGVHLVLVWRGRNSPAPAGHPLVPMLSISLGGAPSYADIVLPADGTPPPWRSLARARHVNP